MKCLLLRSAAIMGLALAPFAPGSAAELCVQLDAHTVVHGVLELPEQGAPDTALIIIPGTQVGNRDGNPGDFGPGSVGVYQALASGLRRQGLAVARFDAPRRAPGVIGCDGSVGQGEPDPSLALQGEAVLKLTAQLRADGHYRRLAWLGHSQGGLVAAQLAQRHPRVVDAVFTYGMSLRPMREASRFGFVNLQLDAIRGLMGDACVDNAALRQEPASAMLLRLNRPIEKWLSPSGRWCPNMLQLLQARAEANMAPIFDPANPCLHGAAMSGNAQLGNSCDEIRLFNSQDGVASLLADYAGLVGIGMGGRDALLERESEQRAFASFARAAPQRRLFKLVDEGGHLLNRGGFIGPTDPALIDDYAGFVAASLRATGQ